MNEAENNIGSFEDSIVRGVIVALILIALFFGLTATLVTIGVILVLGPGLVVVGKMISFVKNIADKTGQFFIRVSNFVFGKTPTTSKGSGWGMYQASDPIEKLPAGVVGTRGFVSGGNVVGDPTLEAVNSVAISSVAHIGEVGGKPNYTASFPLGDPFQGPSYLIFGPLDEIKFTPFWLPVVEASDAKNAEEEEKYLKLCPYINPLYTEPEGLAGNSYDNPLIVKYDNSENTPQYNYYGYVDSNADQSLGLLGSSFGTIGNGSYAIDDAEAGIIKVPITEEQQKSIDVSNAGAVRLSSNSAVWVKDMRTLEIRLVPFQTLNGNLRTSIAETSLKYEYIETNKLSEQRVVKDIYGNATTATTSATDPLTGNTVTRTYDVTEEWTVTTGGKADVSAVLNLGFGLSPLEGYVLNKRTGLLINQDKVYAVPELKGKFTVSGGYVDPTEPLKAANFSYYHESPGAGIVIFNLRSTGADSLINEEDKKAYYTQQKAWSEEEFNKWYNAVLEEGEVLTAGGLTPNQEIYRKFWEDIMNSDEVKPDFMIKETNEQFIISMEYKPFTGDMIKYWADKMPDFEPKPADIMKTVKFKKDEGGWKTLETIGEDGSVKKVLVPDIIDVTKDNGVSFSFLSKDFLETGDTSEYFKNLYYEYFNPVKIRDGIDSQGFNSRLGVKGIDKSATHPIPLDPLNTGKIYADPFKDMPESFISRFAGFNPFTAFGIGEKIYNEENSGVLTGYVANHSISTPLFAFESGVETYVGASSAEYTQFATYKTTGLHEGYTDPITGKMVPVIRTAGEQIKDLSTDKPFVETVVLPGIKIPWGPNPISAKDVVLPLTDEELNKFVSNNSMAFDAYHLPDEKPNFAGFEVKLSEEAIAFYKKLKGLMNANSVYDTENLNYLPLMDKTKLQKYTATDALTGKPLPSAEDRAVYPLYVEGTKSFYLTEFGRDPSSGNADRFVTKYEIYRGVVSGGTVYLKTIMASEFPFKDTSVLNGTTYYYKIKATYNNGETEWSPEQVVTPSADPLVLVAPLGFSAIAGAGFVTLTWNIGETPKWELKDDFVEPGAVIDSKNYKYIVTPKLPDDFAVFTKYISYSEGKDFNKSALERDELVIGSEIVDNYNTKTTEAASTNYESDFTYKINKITGLPEDKNKVDELLTNFYKITQGDMNPDGTLTAEALKKIEDINKKEYRSASEIGTFAIVDPKDYYSVPQEYNLNVTEDNIYKMKDINDVPLSTPVVPPSLKDLSTFKGFPNGSPLGSLNTCVTSFFGTRSDVGTSLDFHLGIDLSTGGVSKPIYATMNGVVRTGTTINGGNVIEIWSSYVGSDNKKYYVRVRYAHTSYASLGDGTEVKPGDLIGYSGNSGIPFEGMGAAYGYHLHYEVRISATFADLMDGRKSAKNPLTAGFGLEGIGTCH